ncbi:TraR/DksA C4-type zinc finger protein [Brevundimonas aurantiaca]|jgi:phage/conjugal plasmid C-4 type zinc finger TraR family protein|uniref:TraR/DksA C4-type zinc finger protein n=1 Tax=Brevundimonas aurantiaca TaxID=74316 RepID=UPI002FDD9435
MAGDFADQAEAVEAMHRRFALEAAQQRAAQVLRGEAEARACDDCGDPIPADRQKAAPGARRCILCEAARERRERFR